MEDFPLALDGVRLHSGCGDGTRLLLLLNKEPFLELLRVLKQLLLLHYIEWGSRFCH
jgi:hypothetical protein